MLMQHSLLLLGGVESVQAQHSLLLLGDGSVQEQGRGFSGYLMKVVICWNQACVSWVDNEGDVGSVFLGIKFKCCGEGLRRLCHNSLHLFPQRRCEFTDGMFFGEFGLKSHIRRDITGRRQFFCSGNGERWWG